MIVHFEKVGRYALSFDRECKDDLTYEWLKKQVGKHCMSNDLNFDYNRETRKGYILGGFQTIGMFWWEI